MAAYLLDVNVLVALAWSNHIHHAKVQQWFSKNTHQGWATCPVTQAGFVRISANPKIVQAALSPGEALTTLIKMTAHPSHVFWPADLSLIHALNGLRLGGHRQITDAYLTALAIHHGGKLVTLDRAIVTLGLTVELI